MDGSPKIWPHVFLTNELKSLVLAVMSRQDVVMLVLKDFELEVIGFGYLDLVIIPQETVFT